MPMTTSLHVDQTVKITLPDPYGNLLRRFVYTVFFGASVIWKIIKIRPDIVHINNLDMFISFSFLKLVKHDLKFVLDLIDTREDFLKGKMLRLAKFSMRFMDFAFITAPLYYEKYLKIIDPELSKRSVAWVPNAPMRRDFDGLVKTPHRGLQLGYFGFLRGADSINMLSEILAELNLKGQKISILFAGIGIEKPLVEQLADKYSFVKYFGPFNYTNVRPLYEQIDIVYSVYLLDHNKKIHMSCRLSEAINCNLPIIVQADSYQAEYVQKYDIGYVVKYGQKQELKTLLKRIYEHPQELDSKAENCASIKHEHVFENHAGKILDSYNELLNK